MPISALLYIGESFVEFGLAKESQVQLIRRWPLGKEPLARGLGRALLETKGENLDELIVVTKSMQGVLRRRFGSGAATLVTMGFEKWLEMNRPIRQTHFTVLADRIRTPLDSDLIFGLSERINVDGQVEKPIEWMDLEFLVAKLKLHNVEEVALCFLHSTKNSTHENLAAEFFRSKEIRVHSSHEWGRDQNEQARWWAATLNAYLSLRFREMVGECQKALDEANLKELPVRLVSSQGLSDANAPQAPLMSFFGQAASLEKWRQSQNKQTLFYLGFEDFLLFDGRFGRRQIWRSELGPVAIDHPAFVRCEIQPTQLVEKSFWGVPALSRTECGYEPGPMAMGRGLVPTLLDILWLQSRIDDSTGLEKLAEKNRSRVEEALTAIARDAGLRPPPASEMVRDLEWEAARRLLAEISDSTKEVAFCGPLSQALRPALEPLAKSLNLETIWLHSNEIMMSALAMWQSESGDRK